MPNKKKFILTIGQITRIRSLTECDAIIDAAFDQKCRIVEAMGTSKELDVRKELTSRWREYAGTLVKGPTGRLFCPYCERHVTITKFHRYVFTAKPTPALHNGQEIVVRPCCLQCEAELRRRYEKEVECQQQQRAELVQLKRVAKVMSRGVSDLLKKESRRAKSSPAS